MRVTVSVFGRFHAFYLARELERRGHLRRLITSHPRFNVVRWGVPGERVKSLWPVEAGRRILERLPSAFSDLVGGPERALGLYDRWAARRIPGDSELFVGWSGSAERAIRRAQDLGATTILERCSSHIRFQRSILREEYERHGVEPSLPAQSVVEREEREYESADLVAVPSTFVERSFREEDFPSARLLQIPYGVDPDEFTPVPKEDDVFRLVYAGHLGYRKGVQYLLRAWADLALPDAELLLLGPVRREFRPLLDEYRGHFRHPGSVPQKELYRWYSQGSVFVLPSVEEGMAYVQLQAMACGLPLVCTPNTGGEDLIREGREGFVVPIRDVEALKERITWCYEHQDECRAMGRLARQRVLDNFTWRDYGERVMEAYERARIDGGDGAS